jgi:methylmalonyl-CoA/ethylmalonyl-CoA epimerase
MRWRIMAYPTDFEHIGWAVNSIDEAEGAFRALGFERRGGVTDDGPRGVRILLLKNREGVTVELVSPMDGGKSPVTNFLEKNGPSPYHCCFAVDRSEMESTLDGLSQAGFKVIIKPSPAPALGGGEVIFLYSKHVGIVELALKGRV